MTIQSVSRAGASGVGENGVPARGPEPGVAGRGFQAVMEELARESQAAEKSSGRESRVAGRSSGLESQATGREELEEVFGDFVGQTLYSQMLASMRKTVDKPAYFHGGRAEEVFQGQLDQMFAERMTDATKDQFTGPMFDLFMLARH